MWYLFVHTIINSNYILYITLLRIGIRSVQVQLYFMGLLGLLNLLDRFAFLLTCFTLSLSSVQTVGLLAVLVFFYCRDSFVSVLQLFIAFKFYLWIYWTLRHTKSGAIVDYGGFLIIKVGLIFNQKLYNASLTICNICLCYTSSVRFFFAEICLSQFCNYLLLFNNIYGFIEPYVTQNLVRLWIPRVF